MQHILRHSKRVGIAIIGSIVVLIDHFLMVDLEWLRSPFFRN